MINRAMLLAASVQNEAGLRRLARWLGVEVEGRSARSVAFAVLALLRLD